MVNVSIPSRARSATVTPDAGFWARSSFPKVADRSNASLRVLSLRTSMAVSNRLPGGRVSGRNRAMSYLAGSHLHCRRLGRGQ